MEIAADITFHPRWWHEKAGVDFDRKFFWDPDYRIEADRAMRRELFRRFGDVGLGDKDPAPRPILGSDLIASGFLFSEILGCDILYTPADPPEVLCRNLEDEEVADLKLPHLEECLLWQDTLKQAAYLEAKYGYVESHINLQGVQNIALDLRGTELFIDYYIRPELARKLLEICTELMLAAGKVLRQHSRFLSHGVTSITRLVMPEVYVTSNCTVEMVSLQIYEEFLLPCDARLAEVFRPFGIHHCGKTMEHVVAGYAKLCPEFAEVGAFSDIRAVREALPETFLNLRYSPVRLKDITKDELAADIQEMLEAGGPTGRVSISCVGIDHMVEDDRVKEFMVLARRSKQ
ncbi:MAG: hypothetical protein ACPL5F_11525 [Moorellaceae bacterium]